MNCKSESLHYLSNTLNNIAHFFLLKGRVFFMMYDFQGPELLSPLSVYICTLFAFYIQPLRT